MARGPLPTGNARRSNQPTIPTTSLPAGGRRNPATGKALPAPRCPYALGKRGKAWWSWAWKLPQACGWDAGALYIVARRAQLEDEMAGLAQAETLADIFTDDQVAAELSEQVKWVVSALLSRVGGSTTLMREMRELDDRLGLSPKGLAALRWTIVADSQPAAAPPADRAPSRRRLYAVDPAVSG